MPNSNMINKTFKIIRVNFSYLLGSEVAIRAMMLILTINLARAYSPEKFGIYALALTIGNLFEIIFNMGISTIFLQRVAGKHEEMQKELSLFLPLRIVLSTISFVFFVLFAAILQKNGETFFTLILAGLYFSLFSIEMLLWSCFDAKQKMKFTAGVKFLEYSVIFGIGMFFILRKAPMYDIMWGYLTGVILTTIITLILISKFFSKISFNFNWKEWLKIIAEGWPIALSGAFVFIYNSLDTVIISIMKGEEAVGLYQVSYKIIGTLFLFAMLINQAYLPPLIESWNKKDGKIGEIFRKGLRSIFFWSIPITFGAMILGDRIILYVFGEQYLAGVPAFKILIWNCVIFFLSSAMTNLLYAVKKQRSAMIMFFTGAVANTVLNIFMIPLFGIEGAALTTVLAELTVLIGMWWLTRKIIKLSFISSIWKPIVAGLIMSGGLLFIRTDSLFLVIGIGALIYFGMYFLLSKSTAPSAVKIHLPPPQELPPTDY